MRRKIFRIVFLFIVGCTLNGNLFANEKRLIPFQGRLTDADNRPVNGTHTVIFTLYDLPTGGTAVWSESHPNVSIFEGYINLLLGTISPINKPESENDETVINFSDPKYIGIKIGSSGQEMLPRHRVLPSFHAQMSDTAAESFNARNADKLGNRPWDEYAISEEIDTSMDALKTMIDNLKADFDSSIDALNRRLAEAEQSSAPIGSIVWFTGTSIPQGWMECNGRELSRTDPKYVALWKHAEDSGNMEDRSKWASERKGGFSYGDGTNTFTIPDLRGEFIRGWNNDSTVDNDRLLGSNQTDAGRDIIGKFGMNGGGVVDSNDIENNAFFTSGGNGFHPERYKNGGNYHINFEASRSWGQEHTADEFRPRNVPMIPIIRYK